MREADASPSLAATVNLDDPCFAQRSDDMPNRIRRYCLDLSLPIRTRNELLCRMTADACGGTVVAGPAEATAIGNLLVQASAAGALPAGTSIRDVVRSSVALVEYTPVANEAEYVIDEGQN